MTWITKYESEKTNIKVGEVWLVQIEPIVLGQEPRELEVIGITKTTVEFKNKGKYSSTTHRYLHSAILFLEKLDEA